MFFNLWFEIWILLKIVRNLSKVDRRYSCRSDQYKRYVQKKNWNNIMDRKTSKVFLDRKTSKGLSIFISCGLFYSRMFCWGFCFFAPMLEMKLSVWGLLLFCDWLDLNFSQTCFVGKLKLVCCTFQNMRLHLSKQSSPNCIFSNYISFASASCYLTRL